MVAIEKILIMAGLIVLLLIVLVSKNCFAQRYEDGAPAVQVTAYPYYNLKDNYRGQKFGEKFRALSLAIVHYKEDYKRTALDLFYSHKKFDADLHKTEIKEYIASYAWGFLLLSTPQHLFSIYTDLGPLLGYTEVNNYDLKEENIRLPFKSGITFGAYAQLTAEVSLLDFLVVFARTQLSYNGPLVYEQWPFYQGLGVRVVF